ncbi:MAG: hypothetical protein A2293_07515 [Elusimicrobia bacterium RIFOXYB2_FULL_49_7]|nr:MAG: hypothetical protein A2293_07515 [Elusimicrobia bacterium RIFOXYB2_FULL_49_7]
MIRLIFLGMIFLLCLSCKPAPKIGKAVNDQKLVDGIYEGSYKGGPNFAAVKVTIRDNKIAAVEIVKHDAWKGKKAEPVIPGRIIEKQSTNVDAVTGATNSSHVIMNAVQNAVEKAYAK